MNRECWYPDKCVRLCIINPSLCTGSKHFSSPFDDHHFHFHCPHPTSITLSLQCYFKTHFHWEKRKTNLLEFFLSRQNLFIFAFWKCFQCVQPGNRFKGTFFCCKIVFEWIGFCCGWLWVCWVAAIDMELCAWQLFWIFFCCNLYNYNCHIWAIVTWSIDWNHLISFCFLFSHECIKDS